jgi:hypothetical protein
MTDAFDLDRADFSGMDGNRDLYIGSVLHKAFVSVDENGTEAAAATAVIMELTSALPGEPIVFTVDRPFIFLIRDSRTGGILFVGRVMAPEQYERLLRCGLGDDGERRAAPARFLCFREQRPVQLHRDRCHGDTRPWVGVFGVVIGDSFFERHRRDTARGEQSDLGQRRVVSASRRTAACLLATPFRETTSGQMPQAL